MRATGHLFCVGDYLVLQGALQPLPVACIQTKFSTKLGDVTME